MGFFFKYTLLEDTWGVYSLISQPFLGCIDNGFYAPNKIFIDSYKSEWFFFFQKFDYGILDGLKLDERLKLFLEISFLWSYYDHNFNYFMNYYEDLLFNAYVPSQMFSEEYLENLGLSLYDFIVMNGFIVFKEDDFFKLSVKQPWYLKAVLNGEVYETEIFDIYDFHWWGSKVNSIISKEYQDICELSAIKQDELAILDLEGYKWLYQDWKSGYKKDYKVNTFRGYDLLMSIDNYESRFMYKNLRYFGVLVNEINCSDYRGLDRYYSNYFFKFSFLGFLHTILCFLFVFLFFIIIYTNFIGGVFHNFFRSLRVLALSVKAKPITFDDFDRDVEENKKYAKMFIYISVERFFYYWLNEYKERKIAKYLLYFKVYMSYILGSLFYLWFKDFVLTKRYRWKEQNAAFFRLRKFKHLYRKANMFLRKYKRVQHKLTMVKYGKFPMSFNGWLLVSLYTRKLLRLVYSLFYFLLLGIPYNFLKAIRAALFVTDLGKWFLFVIDYSHMVLKNFQNKFINKNFHVAIQRFTDYIKWEFFIMHTSEKIFMPGFYWWFTSYLSKRVSFFYNAWLGAL